MIIASNFSFQKHNNYCTDWTAIFDEGQYTFLSTIHSWRSLPIVNTLLYDFDLNTGLFIELYHGKFSLRHIGRIQRFYLLVLDSQHCEMNNKKIEEKGNGCVFKQY